MKPFDPSFEAKCSTIGDYDIADPFGCTFGCTPEASATGDYPRTAATLSKRVPQVLESDYALGLLG